jgi:hypothetical protein
MLIKKIQSKMTGFYKKEAKNKPIGTGSPCLLNHIHVRRYRLLL